MATVSQSTARCVWNSQATHPDPTLGTDVSVAHRADQSALPRELCNTWKGMTPVIRYAAHTDLGFLILTKAETVGLVLARRR